MPGNENLPPMYFLRFAKEEFGDFLADPTKAMRELGHEVEHLNVTLSSSAWITTERKWVKASDAPSVTLPESSTWQWMCGYSDEMCVCYQVLVP